MDLLFTTVSENGTEDRAWDNGAIAVNFVDNEEVRGEARKVLELLHEIIIIIMLL